MDKKTEKNNSLQNLTEITEEEFSVKIPAENIRNEETRKAKNGPSLDAFAVFETEEAKPQAKPQRPDAPEENASDSSASIADFAASDQSLNKQPAKASSAGSFREDARSSRAMEDENQMDQQELDSDLFDPDKALKKKKRKKKKSGRRIGFKILGVLCLILLVCVGVLFYMSHDMNQKFTARKEEAIAQRQDYTTLIDSSSLPEGWSQETFDALKKQANDAYDSTYIDTLTKAESGDKDAQAAIQDDTVAQPDQSKLDLYRQIFSNLNAYPAALADLLVKDPNMLSFVAAYPANGNAAGSSENLTETVTEVPVLSASDPRWGYMPYGNSIMAVDGSAPVVLSMILSRSFEDPSLTPVYMAHWAEEYGYDKEPVRDNDSIFSGAAYFYGINMSPMSSYKTQVNSALSQGSLVAVGLKEGETTHYILVLSANEDGTWNIIDPLTTQGVVSVDPDTIKDQLDGVYAFWQSYQ